MAEYLSTADFFPWRMLTTDHWKIPSEARIKAKRHVIRDLFCHHLRIAAVLHD